MKDRSILLLLIACAGLVAVNGFELRGGGDDGAVTAKPRARIDRAAPVPQAPPPPVAPLMATVLARPLFSPTRRPAAQDEPVAEDLTGKRLTGIVIAPERRLAIFAVSGSKPLILGEGQSVSGWQIETITPTEVSLRGPTGQRTLQPKMDPNLPVQAPAASIPSTAQPRPPFQRPPAPVAAGRGTVATPPAAITPATGTRRRGHDE